MGIKTLARMTQHFLKLSIIFGLLQAKIIGRRTEVNIYQEAVECHATCDGSVSIDS
jgi:hypothetical protein